MSTILDLRRFRLTFALCALGVAGGETTIAAAIEAAPLYPAAEGVRRLVLASAQIDSVVMEPAGQPFSSPVGPRVKPTTVPIPFCRVRGVLKPSPVSRINFEVWLPVSGWNGRFNQIGNAGLAGTILYDGMKGPLMRGFAVAATDDGTVPDSVEWMREPERVKDYGYRAVHETCLCAKSIIAACYGRPPKFAYFVGGSKGGQEALMEAHRFPDDFNGITAWSPAADFTHLWARMIWCGKAMRSEKGSAVLSPAKLLLVHRAVLDRNRNGDGGLPTDDFLSHPLSAHFQPDDLLVPDGSSKPGLTARELEAVKLIYSDVRNPRTGEFIAPGMLPGSEAPPGHPSSSGHGWVRFMGDAVHYAQPLLGNAVFHDPKWNWRTFDFDHDMERVDQVLAPIMNSAGPDLRAFKARGGKLLLTQGWDDTAIPARCTIDFFNRVKQDQGSLAAAQTFVRLFLIPGDGHGYGLGPSEISNLEIIGDWVENGRAPRQVVARQAGNDDSSQAGSATRVLPCYPEAG